MSNPDIHLSKNLFPQDILENLQPKKDTILLTKDGTVGIAYNIKKDSEIITSGAMLHLTLKDDRVTPEYFTLVLNSLVVQMQTEIKEKIKESFSLKQNSKELLDVAKKQLKSPLKMEKVRRWSI